MGLEGAQNGVASSESTDLGVVITRGPDRTSRRLYTRRVRLIPDAFKTLAGTPTSRQVW